MDGAVRSVQKLLHLDRARCRREFEMRFTAERMARDYLRLYERLIRPRALREPAAA